MRVKCEWCGMESDIEECGWRFAEPEDGRARGTKIPTCPSCGSSELFEIEEGEDEMSVDLWAWTEECDHRVCVGDCDLCDVAVEEGEENEE